MHALRRVTLLSLHNPVARAARALAGRYTGSVPPGRAQREPQGYAGLTKGNQVLTHAARAAAKQPLVAAREGPGSG